MVNSRTNSRTKKNSRTYPGFPGFPGQVDTLSIQKIATGQGDDYTTGCLLDYDYFKNYYKMIAID